MSNELLYIRFFNECLNHNMILKKYVPVQDYIFKIISFINKQKLINNNEIKIEFSKTILDTFTEIMERNGLEYLDEYIDFLEAVNFGLVEYSSTLLTIIFGKEAFRDQVGLKDYLYNSHMRKICKYAADKRDNVLLLNGDSRFINLMKIFAKYVRPLPMFGSRKTPLECQSLDFFNIAYSIVNELYLTDIDLKYLDTFLYDLSNNYNHVMSYLELNNLLSTSITSKNVLILNNPLEFIVNYSKEKKIIK